MKPTDGQIIAMGNYLLVRGTRDKEAENEVNDALLKFDEDPKRGIAMGKAEREGHEDIYNRLKGEREELERTVRLESRQMRNQYYRENGDPTPTDFLEEAGVDQEILNTFLVENGIDPKDHSIEAEQQAQLDYAQQIQDNQTEPAREQEQSVSQDREDFTHATFTPEIESNNRSDIDDRQQAPNGDLPQDARTNPVEYDGYSDNFNDQSALEDYDNIEQDLGDDEIDI